MTYSDLEDESLVTILGLQSVENRGKLVGVELDYRKPLVSVLLIEKSSIEMD